MTTTPLAAPTQRQIMLSLAYLAYCGSKMTTASPEATILGYINAAMPQIPPIASPNSTWQVVWGPGVYTTPGALYQENMMFVAQNQVDETQFAIAIRGTNADLDWLLEAFVAQARYQHGSSYPTLLGVTALLDPSIIVTAPPSST